MIEYDPIKDRLGELARRSTLLHRSFFRALDLLFLRAWYVHRVLRTLLAGLEDSRVDVLDAGTGFGQYAYWLLRQDERVHVAAVDVKQDYLATARHFFDQVGLGDRIELDVADLTRPLPHRDRFHLALSVDVLEHIDDDEAVFRNVFAALRPGGCFVVNTPSDAGGSDATATGASFIGEHVREGYAPEELRRKLEGAGFEVVDWTYTYGRYGALGWRLLIKQPMRLLNRHWLLAPLLAPYYAVAGPAGLALNLADVWAEKPSGTGLLVVARRLE